MTLYPDSNKLKEWEDHSSEGTTSFTVDLLPNTFFHVLRKRTKVTFSIRQITEIIRHEPSQPFDNPASQTVKKSSTLSRWVTLISFTVAVSKKGRLTSFLSRTISPKFLSSLRYSYEPTDNNQRSSFYELMNNQMKFRHTQRRGVLNTSSRTSGVIQALINYLYQKEGIASYNEKDTSVSFFSREIHSLLQRNNVEKFPLEDPYSIKALDEYISLHTYPLAYLYPNMRDYMSELSYDATEAISAENFDGMLNRIAFARETELKKMLTDRFLREEPISDKSELLKLVHVLNCLVITKSYVPDVERVQLLESVLKDPVGYFNYEILNEQAWTVLRGLFKIGKENEDIRKQALNILEHFAFFSDNEHRISNLYIESRLEQEDMVAADADRVNPFFASSNMSKHVAVPPQSANYSRNRSGYYLEGLELPAGFIPTTYYRSDETLVALLNILESTNNNKSLPSKTIPSRIIKSYRKTFKAASVTGHLYKDVEAFLEDERSFLKRKLRRHNIEADDTTVDKLVALSIWMCVESARAAHKDRPKKANIPNKVFQAVAEGVEDELVRETVLTDIEDYDTIRETFGLIEGYRHAILDIKMPQDVYF